MRSRFKTTGFANPNPASAAPASPARRRHLQQLAALLAGAGAGPAAWALVGGSGLQEVDANAAWASVGSLDCGRGLFTATPLDRRHVITAAHVAAGSDVRRISFRLSTGGGFVSSATALHVHPAFRGMGPHNPPTDPTAHHDLAIIRLADTLPESVSLLPVFTGDIVGRTLTLVSHGGSTTLVSVGENMADVTFPDDFGRPATYLFDFDGPDLTSNRFGPPLPVNGTLGRLREAALVGGDSGSAALVYYDGLWWLAGINSFRITFNSPPDAGGHGVAGGGIVLGSYSNWIQSVIGAG